MIKTLLLFCNKPNILSGYNKLMSRFRENIICLLLFYSYVKTFRIRVSGKVSLIGLNKLLYTSN